VVKLRRVLVLVLVLHCRWSVPHILFLVRLLLLVILMLILLRRRSVVMVHWLRFARIVRILVAIRLRVS
jgi:hypothetical protein